jgi:hypothetical protein
MKRAVLLVLGTSAGFMLGVGVFVIVNFGFDGPFNTITSGNYTSLVFGGVGAIGGAVIGWAVYTPIAKLRIYTSVPTRPRGVGEVPYKGPFG